MFFDSAACPPLVRPVPRRARCPHRAVVHSGRTGDGAIWGSLPTRVSPLQCRSPFPVILRRLRRRRISSAPGGFIKTRENTNLAPGARSFAKLRMTGWGKLCGRFVSWSTAERSRRRDEHCSSARFPELQSLTAADQWSALRRWRRRRRDQGIAPYAAHIGLPLHRGSRRAADSRPYGGVTRHGLP